MKRLGLCVVNCRCGFVGEYIYYLLNDINQVLTDLYVIVKGKIDTESFVKLDLLCQRIISVADDVGFPEIGRAILKEIEIKEIQNYDELVILNDSFYGPFFSFKNVFEEMEKSPSSFWGITKRGAYQYKDKEFNEYIQNYFMVVRKPIIDSSDFSDYIMNLENYQILSNKKNYDFDYGFTWYFGSKGFRYDTFVKDWSLNVETLSNYDHTRYSPYMLLNEYRMPLILRDSFIKGKSLYYSEGEEITKACYYIKEKTNYDINLIWDDLLKKCNISEIKDCLNLNYILPDYGKTSELPEDKRIAVVAHLYYEDLATECLRYLQRLSKSIDIYITSSRIEIIDFVNAYIDKNNLNNFFTRIVSNRGRDIGAIFVECSDIGLAYDYLCFVHDKKTSGGRGVQIVGQSFFNLIWDNLIKTSEFVNNVINVFEKEPRLGVLSPPIPIHAGYEMLLARGWTLNFQNTLDEARKMGLDVPIEDNRQPFAFSSCFWCRTQALKKMWTYGLVHDDFSPTYQKIDGELNHAIERIIIYVAQDAGYYSGIVENVYWASTIQQNLYIHMRKLLKERDKKYTKKNNKRLNKYLKDKDRIYVYGAGMEGEKAQLILEQIGYAADGYIVSDDHYKNAKSNLAPLIRLSDVNFTGAGIIIAMNEFNEKEALNNLEKKGIKDAIPLFPRD